MENKPMEHKSNKIIGWVIFAGVVGVIIAGAGLFFLLKENPEARGGENEKDEQVLVTVVRPLPGGLERITRQPGTLEAFDFEDLFVNIVSGFLKNQHKDIGDRVTKGEVLAEIDAPDLVAEVHVCDAAVHAADAKVNQAEKQITVAKKQLEMAHELVEQRDAEKESKQAAYDYRKKQYKRFSELLALKSIDARLVDEEFDKKHTAFASLNAAKAAWRTAKVDVLAKIAQVDQAEADKKAADANLKVAESKLEKAQKILGYTKIVSNYDGIITYRGFHNGDLIAPPKAIRVGAGNGDMQALFRVERTDVMRLIVQVPDEDAPNTNVGDPVDLKIPALPDYHPAGLKISRIAYSQDIASRTMRVEVDVPNPNNLLRHSMYGLVTIHREKASPSAFRVPTNVVHYPTAGAHSHHKGKAPSPTLLVIRDGKLQRIEVHIGLDDGAIAEIDSGLQKGDLVVVQSGFAEVGDSISNNQIRTIVPPEYEGIEGEHQ